MWRNTGEMLGRLIGENISVQTGLSSPLHSVNTDRGQLEQVLLNLAVNARDAMPHGGTLTIKTANIVLDEAFVATNPDLQLGPHVKLVVSDTGSGMDAEIQERIFEPFFTTKTRDSGTGLGLATVFGIISQHKGAILVTSRTGLGTTFEIYLPAVEPRAADRVQLPADTDAMGGTETVLVVEDDASVRQLVCTMLESHGYRVLAADGAEAALALARMQDKPIDLLLIDVVMTGMNGHIIYRHMVREQLGLKVLYMSGYPNDVVTEHGILTNDVLQKPFSIGDLLSRVKAALP
jgi:two-component system cell cycle sensor histidine kinase/response regulator CckA